MARAARDRAAGRYRKAAVVLWALAMASSATPALALPSTTPDPTAGANGLVWTTLQVGGTIYIGGEFTVVGGQPRNHLAAIDASTGSVTSWDPNASGVVYALASGGDGAIYAGGKFNTVAGLARKNLVKIDVGSGAVDTTWRPKASQGVVRALAVGSGRVYFGGTFTRANATERNRLAAVDAATGALTGWNPDADNIVRALDVGPDGSVYVGGLFTTVGGATRLSVARLDADTGDATGFDAGIVYPVFALSVVGPTVYFGGAGVGGWVAAHSADTGAHLWSFHTNGDVQAIDASGTTVYAGGHFNFVETLRRRKLAAFDASSGTLLDWNPRTNGPYGVAAIHITDSALLVGGEFTMIGGVPQERFARLSGTP
jgi:trimeric autotransporter adhesin